MNQVLEGFLKKSVDGIFPTGKVDNGKTLSTSAMYNPTLFNAPRIMSLRAGQQVVQKFLSNSVVQPVFERTSHLQPTPKKAAGLLAKFGIRPKPMAEEVPTPSNGPGAGK
jgi:hypothetical protein